MAGSEIEALIRQLSRLPGLGPRSARRATLTLLRRRETLLEPLQAALDAVGRTVRPCSHCGNLDTADPCSICIDPARDRGLVCVVAEVGDLWAMEEARAHRGHYLVLGGLLSPLDGVGPDDLAIGLLEARIRAGGVKEVILALAMTPSGQTTAHYVADRLAASGVIVTALAHGVPMGGELDHLDSGTLSLALSARRPLQAQ